MIYGVLDEGADFHPLAAVGRTELLLPGYLFAEADAASRAQYAAMTPQQRLDLVLELSLRYREESVDAAEGRG